MLPDKYVLPVIILIIIQILGMIKNIRHKQIDSFFWLCEFSSGLLLIGFLTSNTQLIKAAINTGFLPNLISVIMLSFVVFFGVKVKAFEGTPEKGSFYVIVTYLIHLFSINIALLYTAGIKATSLSLIYGTIIYVLVFITSRSFTKPKNNVNFVWKDDILNVPNKYHKVLWFFVVIFVLIVPTYLLQNWIFHLINR